MAPSEASPMIRSRGRSPRSKAANLGRPISFVAKSPTASVPVIGRASLLGLFVGHVLAAPLAELLDLHAVGMRPPVLGRGVVPPLALGAGERNDVAHRLLRDLRDD